MKVLLDGRPTQTGIHRYIVGLTRLLADINGDLDFQVFGQEPRLTRRAGPAGTGRPWPVVSNLRRLVTEQVFLPRAARRSGVQLFHAPYPLMPVWMDLPTVATCHDLWLLDGLATRPLGWKKYYDRSNLLRVLRRADHLVTLSTTLATLLENRCGVDARRITAIPPPMPAFPVDANVSLGMRQPFLLSVGMLEPRKNLERLLQAQEQTFRRTRVPLYLVGPYGWGCKTVLATVSRLGTAVRYLGRVDDGQLARLYGEATAAVQYSLHEGFDYPVAEALGFGCPVVLSEIPVHRELAGDLGLYASPLNPEELAARLEEVVVWSKARRQEHAAGARRVIERITWEGRAERYLETYRKALAIFSPLTRRPREE